MDKVQKDHGAFLAWVKEDCEKLPSREVENHVLHRTHASEKLDDDIVKQT